MSEKLKQVLQTVKKEVGTQNQISGNFNADSQTTVSGSGPIITSIETEKTFKGDKQD